MANLNRNCDPRRHAWLMTDARIDAVLFATLRRLPPGAGVVVRHHHLSAVERHRLVLRIRRIAHARRLRISAAGALPGAPSHSGPRALTYAAHDRRQAIAGVRAGAAWLFVSPVHATRSHPGAAPLGLRRASTIARGLAANRVALGGMTAARWLASRDLGFDGWAAIDGLTQRRPSDQKRKAVPT
ncbi:thiamine phosphate synthase [Sphingomonas sp. A2-49]|uniref:thiamine phosphate synthase n=1 Tax=Sphingomonas sp. A2-49 TaxID=1391375 RepID=UPI0021D355AA|nr:thiamine phosphate synthase [Sphingomonas sp. A2-49]MCU6454223.1 thiamine phosphate synthase [Sphingomonas sp. A2-49]